MLEASGELWAASRRGLLMARSSSLTVFANDSITR